LAAKAVIDAFQPVIQALTVQLTQLTVALKQQRIDFACQYKALQAEFTAQTECLKAEIAASISTQLSNIYVLASSSSYAAVAQAPPPLGTLLPKSLPLSQPSNLAFISISQASVMSETLYCTIDTSKVDESKQREVQLSAI
jgi:hypothetical protein